MIPSVVEIVELFETWHAHHGEKPTTAANLAEPRPGLCSIRRDAVGNSLPRRLSRLAGTCAGGFVTDPAGNRAESGVDSTYALRRT